MKRLALLLALLLAIPALAEKKYTVKPDSPEEKLLLEIQGQGDINRRLMLAAEFQQKFADSPALPAIYPILLQTYVDTQDFDKAVAVADKAAEGDPDDFNIAVNALRASQAKNDFARVLKYVQACMPMYQKSAATDTKDMDEDEIKKRNEALKNTITFLEYTLWDAASRDTSADRPKYLEAFTQLFPKSEHIKEVPAKYALHYGQQQNVAKMMEWAEKATAANPDDEAMLLLVSDTYVSQRQNLPQAEDIAGKLLKVMEAKKKPEGAADADWQKYVDTYVGGAHSVKGRVLMLQEKTTPAIAELESARKLLEPTGNNASLSPVLYFLGFGYAKDRNYTAARPVLEQAVTLGGPYAAASQDIIKKLPPAAAKKAPARKRTR